MLVLKPSFLFCCFVFNQTGKTRTPAPFNSFCIHSPALLCPKILPVSGKSRQDSSDCPPGTGVAAEIQRQNDFLKATQKSLRSWSGNQAPAPAFHPQEDPRSEGRNKAFLREDWPRHPSLCPDPSGICKGCLEEVTPPPPSLCTDTVDQRTPEILPPGQESIQAKNIPAKLKLVFLLLPHKEFSSHPGRLGGAGVSSMGLRAALHPDLISPPPPTGEVKHFALI